MIREKNRLDEFYAGRRKLEIYEGLVKQKTSAIKNSSDNTALARTRYLFEMKPEESISSTHFHDRVYRRKK